jgi:hypothetical protein
VPLDAFEHTREHAIVRVEVGLALDQAGTLKVIEAQQAGAVQPVLQRAHEHLPFLNGDQHAFIAQAVEEIEKTCADNCRSARECQAARQRADALVAKERVAEIFRLPFGAVLRGSQHQGTRG